MYPQGRIVRQALMLGLLVTLVVLALSACRAGGQEEGAKARPLPEDEKALHPGEYNSVKFKPSASFKVGKGWLTSPPEASDVLELEYGMTTELAFSNVREVYKPILKPTQTSTPEVMKVPDDLAAWLQHHPYLKTDEPESVTVGGAKGEQFDVLVKDLPEDYYGVWQGVRVHL